MYPRCPVLQTIQLLHPLSSDMMQIIRPKAVLFNLISIQQYIFILCPQHLKEQAAGEILFLIFGLAFIAAVGTFPQITHIKGTTIWTRFQFDRINIDRI